MALTREQQKTEATIVKHESNHDKPDDSGELLKVADTIPLNVWLVAIIAGGERLAWYGATGPFQNYLQNDRNSALPGALGLQQDTATLIMAGFFAFSYFTPIPGAVVADAWLGRFWTILIAAMSVMTAATIVLFVTSLPSSIQEPGVSAAGLAVTMVLYALASGSLRAAVSPFIADQYTDTTPQIRQRPNGKKCITSRELTIQYIYNIYYWTGNIAGLGALATTLMERYIGFWAAFLLPLVGISSSCLVLCLFGRRLVRVAPVGSVLVNTSKALVLAARDRFCMDNAKPEIQRAHHNRVVPWNDRFIDEVKLGLLACRIFLLFPFHWLVLNQTFNNLISQAGQMKNYGVPNDSIKSINPISSIIFYPILQKWLYPLLRRKGITFGAISRITIGFALLALAMAIAAIIQSKVYHAAPCYFSPRQCPASDDGQVPNQVNMFSQIPVYVLGAIAEMFCLPAVQELAYNQSPKNMRAMTSAVSMAMAGIGALLAMAFTPLATNPYLVIMYCVLTGIMAVTTIVFYLLFRHVDKEELEMIE